jgi:hypothetical protein
MEPEERVLSRIFGEDSRASQTVYKETGYSSGDEPEGKVQDVETGTPRRVNVQFSPEAYATLREVARQQGKSISETIRDGLKWQRFIQDLRKENGRLLIERDGKVRELHSI